MRARRNTIFPGFKSSAVDLSSDHDGEDSLPPKSLAPVRDRRTSFVSPDGTLPSEGLFAARNSLQPEGGLFPGANLQRRGTIVQDGQLLLNQGRRPTLVQDQINLMQGSLGGRRGTILHEGGIDMPSIVMEVRFY